ncbi:hypothetical protein [Geobacter sp. DSM 9736]|uniref:hypothetical protein n=1 Tax=Geobacter sp. DSM 9736 TaxID=1277350 RepID=UPI000B5054FD|nr:hypothetical protein [Geobacter sp. DSM 9736]SNB44819.1 hypothetical protein SAMN06269301_0206 [Geobacter sp. DSM 9736]
MKKLVSVFTFVTLIALGISYGNIAHAEEVKMVGVITKIEVAGKDAKTATIVLKDNKTDELVTVVVNDELTLDKFKDNRIVEGDEIRCKYETKEGQNISLIFKKTAGC